MHGFGAVVVPGGEAPYHERWEARVFALLQLVDLEGLGARPGDRATIEEMDPVDYLAASYERSMSAGYGASSSACWARGRSPPARSST